MFGLHPNAEIGYLTNWTASIFEMIQSLGGGDGGTGGKHHTTLHSTSNLMHLTALYLKFDDCTV